MTKRNITLIMILILIVALFTTCTARSCGSNSSDKEIIISSPTPDPYSTLIDNTTEEVKEEKIWIDTVDYTLMTKSQIENRISSLVELIEVVENWTRLTDIYEQAINIC